MDDGASAQSTSLVIKRRTWVQDAIRVYKVILDNAVVGSIGPLRTKRFPISPGKHTLRLAMPTTGRASSDTIELDLKPGQAVVVTTVRRGSLKSFVELPLALPEGAKALTENRPINSRHYERPWIHVKVEVSPA